MHIHSFACPEMASKGEGYSPLNLPLGLLRTIGLLELDYYNWTIGLLQLYYEYYILHYYCRLAQSMHMHTYKYLCLYIYAYTKCGILSTMAFHSAAVRSGNEFHIVQAVFLPYPTNPDMVSQPVSAWNIGRASDFSVPRLAAIRWAAKYQKFFPVPNATQTS